MRTADDFIADLHKKLQETEALIARFEAFGDYDRAEAARRSAEEWRELIRKAGGTA